MNRFIDEPQGFFHRTYRRSGRKNNGKAFYCTVLVLMLVVAVTTAALCAWFASTGDGHSVTGGTAVSDISSIPEGNTSSELPESSVGGADSNNPDEPDTSSQPAASGSVTSDMALILAAEQAFGKNSLDQKHTQAMNQADTMTEMLSVYDDTLEAWRKQLNTLAAKLNAYTTEDQKALHSAWEQETAEKIRKREEALSSQGGTIQQLEVAEYTCMLYRQRGLKLFTELYRYDDTYTF